MKALSTAYQYAARGAGRVRYGTGGKSLASELKEAYISRYFESGRLETHTSLLDNHPVKIVKYNELPETEVAGYPYAVDRNERGELQCYFPLGVPNAHELVIGVTGSGKTSSLVEPRIRVLSSKKNQVNMFISDPKGEIFQRNAADLRRKGYKIFALNFKDVSWTDTWNPLTELYDVWIRQKGLKEQPTQVQGKEHLAEYELHDDPDSYQDIFWSWRDKAFCSETSARRYREDKLADILAETSDLIHQLVYAFIPDSLVSKSDPTWMLGARDIVEGILYAMLEDALDERSGFTRSQMNIMNLQEYFDAIRSASIKPTGNTALLQTKILAHKSDKDMSIKLLRTYFENAPSTSRSYLGVCRNAMQTWFNPKIFTICGSNTIELEDTDKPYAIFLMTRDSERSDFAIASMFIDWIYRKLLEQADNNGGKLQREFFFILDEFANISTIKDFTNKITAARSRNIVFELMIQSYAQLSEAYSPSAAQTIIDNCDCTFMGSQNYETKAKFAKECGRQTIPSMESVLNPASSRMAEVPLLTISSLEKLQLGQMYMKRTGISCLLLSKCEPSFRCPEFQEEKHMTPEKLGIKSLPYNSEQYRYQFLTSGLTMNEYYRARSGLKRQSVKIDPPDYLQEIMK